jgi:hypothetical protein
MLYWQALPIFKSVIQDFEPTRQCFKTSLAQSLELIIKPEYEKDLLL